MALISFFGINHYDKIQVNNEIVDGNYLVRSTSGIFCLFKMWIYFPSGWLVDSP